MKARGLTTKIVHGDRLGGADLGAVHAPIHTSIQYGFDNVEDLIGVFQGTTKGRFSYARQGTPTTAALEAKLTSLEGGVGTVCFASGMAALSAVFLTLLRAGDHLVASQFVFGNTSSVFNTLRLLGVEVTVVDPRTVAGVEAALTPKTRMVFVETIANPATQVPDLAGIGELCRARGLLYVVDNTITSPALFKPKDVGAGIVVNSLSKTVGGHGTALGGAVTDTGLFDWSAYPNIADDYRGLASAQQGLQQVRKKGLRDMGGSLSSEQAHQLALGAETMTLRVAKTSENAQAIAEYLEQHPMVGKVHYPGLASHPQHHIAKQLFARSSWLLAFELRDSQAMIPFLNALQLPVKATGLGDTRSLVIPVAPTIFWEAGPEVRATMGISDGMIRFSAGIEEIDDLLADFEQAFEAAGQ